ncbi:MAG: hypothetical protein ACREP7_08365 [Lysobacter sp.]
MNKKVLAGALCALIVGLPLSALAEDSEKESPLEEWQLAQQTDPMTDQVKKFVSVLEDLDRRYPDSGKVDVDKFMETEGEGVALSYCQVLGFEGACVIESKGDEEIFVPYQASKSAKAAKSWWSWLSDRLFNVGVIPQANACPAGYSWAQIHMDDEDRRNANGRGGWIGATASGGNTTWRFCKVDTVKSLSYRPLPSAGNQYDYAVLNMGVFCPSGARRYTRVQENEIWRNANSSSGVIFPNFRVYNTWFTSYCHFDGGSSAWLGHMSSFPKLGFAHGVFGPQSMPSKYALARGWVHQDDEDILNWNGWWFGGGDDVMNGGRNTWRGLIKVE